MGGQRQRYYVFILKPINIWICIHTYTSDKFDNCWKQNVCRYVHILTGATQACYHVYVLHINWVPPLLLLEVFTTFSSVLHILNTWQSQWFVLCMLCDMHGCTQVFIVIKGCTVINVQGKSKAFNALILIW